MQLFQISIGQTLCKGDGNLKFMDLMFKRFDYIQPKR